MNFLRSHIKEAGIVLSYLWMLVACYVFHWEPFGIFVSYLVEMIVLLFVYLVMRIIDQSRHPQRYRKSQPIVNVLIGIIPLAALQYCIIWVVAGSVDGGSSSSSSGESAFFTREIIYAIIACVVLYTIKAIQLTKNDERLVVFQGNFLFSVLALAVTNLLSLLIISFTGTSSLLVILTGTVVVRIALEIWFDRRMKLI